MEYMTVRNADRFGYRTSRNGTAAKLSFRDAHISSDTKVRNTAFIARNASLAYIFSLRRVYADVPKNTAGTSVKSPIVLIQSFADMLRFNVHFLSSIRENGLCLSSFFSAVIL